MIVTLAKWVIEHQNMTWKRADILPLVFNNHAGVPIREISAITFLITYHPEEGALCLHNQGVVSVYNKTVC